MISFKTPYILARHRLSVLVLMSRIALLSSVYTVELESFVVEVVEIV